MLRLKKKNLPFFCKLLSNICSLFLWERMLQQQQRAWGLREETGKRFLKTLENAKRVRSEWVKSKHPILFNIMPEVTLLPGIHHVNTHQLTKLLRSLLTLWRGLYSLSSPHLLVDEIIGMDAGFRLHHLMLLVGEEAEKTNRVVDLQKNNQQLHSSCILSKKWLKNKSLVSATKNGTIFFVFYNIKLNSFVVVLSENATCVVGNCDGSFIRLSYKLWPKQLSDLINPW